MSSVKGKYQQENVVGHMKTVTAGWTAWQRGKRLMSLLKNWDHDTEASIDYSARLGAASSTLHST